MDPWVRKTPVEGMAIHSSYSCLQLAGAEDAGRLQSKMSKVDMTGRLACYSHTLDGVIRVTVRSDLELQCQKPLTASNIGENFPGQTKTL